MRYSRLWVSAGIILFVVVISFVLSVPHTRDVEVKSTSQEEKSAPEVTLRDSFKKGVHTISGSVLAPNACAEVSASSSLSGDDSSTPGILVEISMQTEPGVCLQIPKSMSFQTTLSAPASLPITVLLNGSPATTTPS